MTDFDERLEELERKLSLANIALDDYEAEMDMASLMDGARSHPYMAVMYALVPVAIFVALFYLRPSYVMKRDKSGKQVVCYMRLVLFTLLFTLVAAAVVLGLAQLNLLHI